MELGLFAVTASPIAGPIWLDTLAREAEARQVSSIWVPEHVVLFDDYSSHYPYSAEGKLPTPPGSGVLEPFTTLSYLAARTSTVRLGTGICLLAQRNPVYAAKEVATLDWLSGGRFEFGIGVGWLEEEYAAVGVPWARRGDRTDEYVRLMRVLWCDDPSSYEGSFHSLPPCNMHPKPVQQPHPPLHFGGESDRALRRVARFGNGWYSFNRLPDDVGEGVSRLERALEVEGRTRADVQVTVCPYFNGCTPELIEQYAQEGIDRVIALLLAFTPDDIPRALDDLEPCFERARALSD